MFKRCPKCGEEKDREIDFFKRSGDNSHLPRSWCKDCERECRRIFDKAHPEKVKVWDKNGHVRFYYGLEPEERQALLALANGRCQICDRERKLCVDHDHITGEVRGVLCLSCNGALGNLGDTPHGLETALMYLLHHEWKEKE